MRLFGRSPGGRSSDSPEQDAAAEDASDAIATSQTVEGERGIPSVNRIRTVQSRVTSILTVTFMSLLAAGLLTWYYSGALTRGERARVRAHEAQRRRAQTDAALPPLGVLHIPTPTTAPKDPTVERLLGPAPPPPEAFEPRGHTEASAGPPPKTPAQLTLERRLGGPVLSKSSEQGQNGMTASGLGDRSTSGQVASYIQPAGLSPGNGDSNQGSGDDPLGNLLRPTPTPAVQARVLPTQRYLLPQGAFIDCTLETAVSSALPGMTTCVTATDTFSADGSVVLLERGTKLVGETRGEVQRGSPRLFVLWVQARTPDGVVVPLASPGTDELGRSGLSGHVDWHWWQRFGSAILITVIDGVVQGESQSRASNAFIFNPSSADQVATEALRGNINIPPTIEKSQGDRIQILVARDVDFRSVYVLRTRSQGGD